jgi:hypothetical protein
MKSSPQQIPTSFVDELFFSLGIEHLGHLGFFSHGLIAGWEEGMMNAGPQTEGTTGTID